MQYSLFICDIDAVELVRLKWSLSEIIAHDIDRVALVDLGEGYREKSFEFMGVRPQLPSAGPQIV